METAGRGYADTPPHDTRDQFAPGPGEYDRDLPVPASSTALDVPRDARDRKQGSGGSSGIQAKITQRPLLSLGAGLIGGMVLGGLLGGGRDRRHDTQSWSGGTRYPASVGSTSESGSDQSGGSSGSLTHSMTEGLRKAAKQSGLEERSRSAATSAASSLNDTLRSTLSKQLPGFDERLRERQQKKG